MAVNRLAESEGVGLFTKAINPWHLCYNCYTSLLRLELHSGSLIPRSRPASRRLQYGKAGEGSGTFPHVSDVTDRANYANVGDM